MGGFGDAPLCPLARFCQPCKGGRLIGLPALRSVPRRGILPDWAGVRDDLLRLSESLPRLQGNESSGAELWRRISLRKPHSQMHPEWGDLGGDPIFWSPPRRVRVKSTLANWDREWRDI